MATDIRTAELVSPVDVGEYLFTRLKQMGVDSVHGVPGDFNLVALDYIPKLGMKWVGNCNELNAGYAADGYARVKGISALVTTFGVGELSAINAIAGAYSEHVPIVHIAGVPSTATQKSGAILHHTLGNGNFNVFADMNREITVVMARLNDPYTIASQIDHALRECWVQSRPVYITLPTDTVQKKIEGERLRTPIDLSYPKNDSAQEDYVVNLVLKSLHSANNPVILVDACAIRHRVIQETHALIEKTRLPVFVTPMGKGAIDESHPCYGGVYAGAGSQEAVRQHVESADLVLSIGAIKSDFNTAGFSYHTSQLNTIDFHSDRIQIRYSQYPGVHMRGVLRKLVDQVDLARLSASRSPNVYNAVTENEDSSQVITQAWFWPYIGSFLEKNDIVITETGTANFGIWETKFPSGVDALSQVLWGSIGYSVGAAQGAALAAKDSKSSRRSILFVGDGSFQLTAQEVSTMLRQNLTPIIFLICNEGYTIERFIHGQEASYNDIQPWRYRNLVDVFGGEEKQAKTFSVKTKEELRELTERQDFRMAKSLQFVEVHMPKDDAPRALKMVAEKAAMTNAT